MSIWPRPRDIETGSGVVWLPRGAECHITLSPKFSANQRIQLRQDVQKMFSDTIDSMHKSPFSWKKLRGQNVPPEPLGETKNASLAHKVVVEILVDWDSSWDARLPEWYQLHIETDGKCSIKVHSYLGMCRALATFTQLFFEHSEPMSELFCPYCPLKIEDEPTFKHRGLNLDIARNIIYPADAVRVLKGMWLNKMNKLHIHATDSQSWPLEIPGIPELAEKGAYDPSQIWKISDVESIQETARCLGIEVYFEIDLPGHTAAIHHSFPELIVGYNQQPWNEFAKEPPAGQLKLASAEVRDFIKRLFDGFLPHVKKHSTLFHLGGDEINKRIYTLEEGLGTDDMLQLMLLLEKFYIDCIAKLSAANLQPVFWEEALIKWNLHLPQKRAIIQSWRSQESLATIVEKGYRALFGPCQYWYLDTGMGQWLEPDPNSDTPVNPKFPDWCPPYKNWRIVYSYDPFEGIEDKYRSQILGGEVHLWGEMTDSVCLDFMLWPRVAAAAEVLWSGPSKLSEEVTQRLAEMRERLVLLGIQSGRVQMEWSLRNPGSSFH